METNSLLLIDIKNIFYVTKAAFEGFWLLLHNNKFIIITSQMIYGQVKHHFKNKAKIFIVKTSFSDEIITICKKYKINKLKIDTTNISYNLF
ncbi:MAG: aminopeptidase P family N-terminal domain-containing protein, partial [Elusimicrobia bacterium]|nr:aminopeptidase P family N-terminal domain-containing protein [Elusimicrobiota bacterium]